MKNKDKKLEKLQKEIEEIEAKLGNRKLADSELKTLFAHADKKKAEIEEIERKRGEAMETPEYSLLLEENYLEALRKIYKERLKGNKNGNYRVSGHLIDQRLKYTFPTDNLPSIFDELKEATIEDMIEYGVEVEGIRLTATETKIVDCLCKLLDESRARTKYNESSSTELAENVAPKLFFTLYELTKEYKGGESVSGKDVANVKTILEELSYKSFLIRYKEVTTNRKTKEKTIKEIEQVRSLIHIDKATLTKEKEGVEHYKKVETVVNLHPIFLKQIDSKFILYPNDINKRTIVAYGSHNVSDMALRLRDYLMREISSKRKKSEIGLEKLYYLLNEKWMNESRKKRVKEGTEKAIETVKNMELITSHEITTNVKGEAKVVFHLNKAWK
jgi:hypothetical protein